MIILIVMHRLLLILFIYYVPISWSAPCEPIDYTFALETPEELSKPSNSFTPPLIKVTQIKGSKTGEGELESDSFTSAYILLSYLADKAEVQRTPGKGDIASTASAQLSISEYKKRN